MSEKKLYLSFTPEALIFSMLPPHSFGKYLALGDKKQSSSQAIFIELDPNIDVDGIGIAEARAQCVHHKDNSPKRSTYASIYRVLERVPLSAFGDLFLATKDGLVLTLKKSTYSPVKNQSRFLYQEICPVNPRVVSTLEPIDFCQYVTNKNSPLYIPKIAFADLKLGELAENPKDGCANNLPYLNIGHLRTCLGSLNNLSKQSKVERRGMRPEIIYYMIEKGFYVGDQNDFLYYQMPCEDLLLGEHKLWWNSAAKIDKY